MFIRGSCIFGTVEIFVIPAGVIGTAVADIRSFRQLGTKIGSEIRTVPGAVAGFAAFA